MGFINSPVHQGSRLMRRKTLSFSVQNLEKNIQMFWIPATYKHTGGNTVSEQESKRTRRLKDGHHLTVSPLPGFVQRSLPVLIPQVRVGSVPQQRLTTTTRKSSNPASFVHASTSSHGGSPRAFLSVCYLGNLWPSETGSVVQRGWPLASVHICTPLAQKLHLDQNHNLIRVKPEQEGSSKEENLRTGSAEKRPHHKFDDVNVWHEVL